jgi:hypothetical protein
VAFGSGLKVTLPSVRQRLVALFNLSKPLQDAVTLEDRLLDADLGLDNPDHHSVIEHPWMPGDPVSDEEDCPRQPADVAVDAHHLLASLAHELITDDEDSDVESDVAEVQFLGEDLNAGHVVTDEIAGMPHVFSMMRTCSSSSSVNSVNNLLPCSSTPATPASSSASLSTAPPSSAASSASALSTSSAAKKKNRGSNKLRKARKATLVPPIVPSDVPDANPWTHGDEHPNPKLGGMFFSSLFVPF